jgi:hypothetical protein
LFFVSLILNIGPTELKSNKKRDKNIIFIDDKSFISQVVAEIYSLSLVISFSGIYNGSIRSNFITSETSKIDAQEAVK